MKKFFTALCLMALSLTTFAATFNIYINNQTGWEQTALYAWADGRTDILGAWPGIQATGTEGDYLVFTVDETIVPANLIFNNNNNGQQVEGVVVETAADIHLVATTTRLSVEGAPAPTFANHIYVEDQTGWDVLNMYAYADGRTTILGSWPGKAAEEETVVDGITYKVFGIEADFAPANIILNNGSTQLADFYIEEQKDYYLVATAAGVAEQGSVLPTLNTYHIYVTNNTGWTNFYLYAWGTPNEPTGAWPGQQGNDFTFQVAEGATPEMHLIFHNNVGEGVEGDARQGFDITEARNYTLTVTAEGVTEGGTTEAVSIVASDEAKTAKRIVNGQLLIIRDGKTFNALGAEMK
ncbi:MAG: starch-binding protein [Paludibacteraceae bacterium]|nr:starch-binding protein [Paludibacteraceae bacterium]